MRETADLPETLDVPWPGFGTLTFEKRFEVPRIWTQTDSRAFAIYWSDKAGHGILHPSPTDAELARFYDTASYREYLGTDRRSGAEGSSIFDRIVTRVAFSLDHSDPESDEKVASLIAGGAEVCDVGCGSGDFLSRVARRGAVPTGVDPSDVSVAATRERGIPCFLGTAEALPRELEDRRFAAVTMHHSLEHCRDPLLALQNLRGMTSPGGVGHFEVPNHENAGFDLYGPAWYHTDAGRHLHFFTARSLTHLAEQAGWTVREVGYLSFTRQFQPFWLDGCRNVFDCMFDDPASAGVPRPTRANNLLHLARSIGMPDGRKYDGLRVVVENAAR